ncbi:MAG: protein kinase, partial [Gammaproteobacteria bacterium]|nr:protein kinase [Gammaproteobacteria bacterium]
VDQTNEQDRTLRTEPANGAPRSASAASPPDDPIGQRSLASDDATQISPSNRGPAVKEGDTIKGRFILEKLLGSGGMGRVFKAVDKRKLEAEDRNPYVAIKVLNEDMRAYRDSVMLLQREARRAQGLAHPNIVRVHDFDRDGETIYLTMEFLVGEPLDRMVRAPNFKGVPVEQGIEIINQVGEALAFAHEHGVAHCDLKPGNIFLTESGEVKVIDFGISRPVSMRGEPGEDVTRFDPSALGALTPAYASPELSENNQAGPASDIFALACVTCELLSGKHPFDRIEATTARDRNLIPTLPASLSRGQANAIRTALMFDPRQRTPSVRQFLADINAAKTKRGSWRVSVGAIAASLVVLIGGIAYYLTNPGTDFGFGKKIQIPSPDTKVAANTNPPEAVPPSLPKEPSVASPRPGGRARAPKLQPGSAAPPPADAARARRGTTGASPPSPDEEPPARRDRATRLADPRSRPDQGSPGGDFLSAKKIEQALAVPENSDPDPGGALQQGAGIAVPAPDTLKEMRKKVLRILDGARCASLRADFEGGAVHVAGYVNDTVLDTLKLRISSVQGVTDFKPDTHPIRQSQCELMQLVAPFALHNRVSNLGLKIRTRKFGGEYKEGENLIIDLVAPTTASYIYIDYFSLDGGVAHILPEPNLANRRVPANFKRAVGEDPTSVQWIIGAPFGIELIIASATSEPLFSFARPEVERSSDYLPLLRRRLQELERQDTNIPVVADLLFLRTSPRR